MRALYDYLKSEWTVLRQAPLAFVFLLLFGIVAGIGASGWFYNQQLAVLRTLLEGKDGQMKANEALVARYRVALGIVPGSKGVLVELTNQELTEKATVLVPKIRQSCTAYRDRGERLQADRTLTEKGRVERRMALMKEMSDEFDVRLRSDTVNVDNELRRRLGPAAVGAIVGVPMSFYSATDGTPIGILSLMGGGRGMSIGLACTFADSIEQMTKMLPPK